jgi:outer membrane protein assembly factor BamD (BamD/ComL family)
MMRNKRILLLLLAIVFLFAGCKMWLPWGKKAEMARATPEGLYQQGLDEYQAGSYKRSVELSRLKEEYPLSPLAIMAEIGIADSFQHGEVS